MSQTLAQRRVLAAHARHRDPPPPSDAPAPPRAAAREPAPVPDARPARESAAGDPERAVPMTGAAGRAVLTLVRSGARVVEVGADRVRLRRAGSDCEVDRRGRVDWRPR